MAGAKLLVSDRRVCGGVFWGNDFLETFGQDRTRGTSRWISEIGNGARRAGWLAPTCTAATGSDPQLRGAVPREVFWRRLLMDVRADGRVVHVE